MKKLILFVIMLSMLVILLSVPVDFSKKQEPLVLGENHFKNNPTNGSVAEVLEFLKKDHPGWPDVEILEWSFVFPVRSGWDYSVVRCKIRAEFFYYDARWRYDGDLEDNNKTLYTDDYVFSSMFMHDKVGVMSMKHFTEFEKQTHLNKHLDFNKLLRDISKAWYK